MGIFLSSTASRPALGPTQPPIQWVSGATSPGQSDRSVKLTSHLHLAPRWRYTSTPQYVFMAWCLVKHRDNFTFTFRSVSFYITTFDKVGYRSECSGYIQLPVNSRNKINRKLELNFVNFDRAVTACNNFAVVISAVAVV
jgi:hypothetical protein